MNSPKGMYWIVFCLSVLAEVATLRIVSLDIPKKVKSGKEVKLTCLYDLEGDRLYSIKWYRDDKEFYRFVPKDAPQKQYFPLDGIIVDLSRSDNMTVYIRDVQVSAGGIFECEVSADSPSFRTAALQKVMMVEASGTNSSYFAVSFSLVVAGLIISLTTEFFSL
ncbi:uncharacterized protein LOC143258591 isoform X4 [Tachypleus tridentatus]|uniref:uncharacterized protein LOC143258591 isoform X4 n=1 Tax=Tachypleus tridentatus TaxID=6853 RepID=UPI003FCF4A36